MDNRHARTMRIGFRLRPLLADDTGQNLVEYGLVVGLVGLAAILSTTNLGTQLKSAFNTIGSVLTSRV